MVVVAEEYLDRDQKKTVMVGSIEGWRGIYWKLGMSGKEAWNGVV